MASAVHSEASTDIRDIPMVVRGSIILGVIQSVLAFAVSLSNRGLDGMADTAITAVLVAVGVIACAFLPAIWVKPRTIDGISTAAGIGLGAALAFLVVDVTLLQPLGTWTNRWHEIGGDSNWWYHPTWWMVGCYISWMGAWIIANQARKGEPSVARGVILVAVLTAIVGAVAVVLGFPGAGWNVGTFAVAVLPALAIGTVSGLVGARG